MAYMQFSGLHSNSPVTSIVRLLMTKQTVSFISEYFLYIEKVLEATPHKAAVVRPPTTHHENYQN